ncbi:DMT family transporter [Parasulfitobacter algicola]|uniref:DMT family transporter n=1 Tax=Parasulfitobacter algicola TaxID=2614809 RepID=A0ABX2IYT0_9RHOB|nr:DMT family transporter [Sulfitobacter algicola]NSX55806.1 DMT family transporter [Sulfitobacter algicola]
MPTPTEKIKLVNYRHIIPAIGVSVLSWAAAFPGIRFALNELEPIPLANIRFLIAGLVATAWLVWTRPNIPRLTDAGIFLICGALGIAAYNIFLNLGQVTVSPGAASFIVNMLPIIASIIGFFALGERLPLRSWIGSLISFFGMALIAQAQPGGLAFGSGAMLVFIAACCAAILFVLQRPLVARYGAVTCTAYTVLAGLIFLLPWSGEGIQQIGNASFKTTVIVVFLGIFPSALAYASWAYSIGQIGPGRTVNSLYLVPPISLTLSFILLRDIPSFQTIIGGSIAIFGVYIFHSTNKIMRRAKTEE